MDAARFTARRDAALRLLHEHGDRPLPAIEIAANCGIADMDYWVTMSHETRRRRVREVIAALREEGWKICAGARPKSECGIENVESATANGDAERVHSAFGIPHSELRSEAQLGYWLARSDREWSEYLESRKANARFEFAMVRDMRTAARERATGQGDLFGDGTGNRSHADWARV